MKVLGIGIGRIGSVLAKDLAGSRDVSEIVVSDLAFRDCSNIFLRRAGRKIDATGSTLRLWPLHGISG